MSSTRRPLSRADAGPIALLAGFPFVLFGDLLFGHVLVGRDAAAYNLPMKQVLRDLLLSGHLPLWNRLFAAGQPVAANPAYETFYPLQVFILLPDLITGFHLQMLVHLSIAGVGAYALLRQLGCGRTAAFAGGFSFAFSGLVVSFMETLPLLLTVAWLPWVLFFYARFVETGNTWNAFGSAAALAMQILIGEPLTLAQTSLLLIAAGVCLRRRRDVIAAVMIVIAAILIGAVQIVPELEFVRSTARGIPLPWPVVSAWSLPPARIVELFFPGFAGTLGGEAATYYGGHVLYGRGLPFLYSIYAGLLMATATVAGLWRRVRGWNYALGVLAISWVLALGSHLPLLRWFYDLGLASSTRFAEKWFIAGVFVIIIFGAVVLQQMIDGDRVLAATAMWIAAAVAIVALLAVTTTAPGVFAKLWRISTDVTAPAAAARTQWMLACGVAAALAMVLSAFRWQSSIAPFLVVAFVILDLGLHVEGLVHRDSRSFYSPPAIAREMPSADRGRTYNDAMIDTYVFGRRLPSGAEQYRVRRERLFPFLPVLWGKATAMEVDIDKTFFLNTTVFNQLASQARGRNDPNFPTFFMRAAGADTLLVASNDSVRAMHLPRISRFWFASHVEHIASPADVDAHLQRGPLPRGVAFAPIPSCDPAPGEVHRAIEMPNETTLDVIANGPAFLVAAVSFDRHWHATIDGRPVDLIPTNVAFQGLVVSPGRHQVRFAYENPLIGIGAAISLASLLGMVFLTRRR